MQTVTSLRRVPSTAPTTRRAAGTGLHQRRGGHPQRCRRAQVATRAAYLQAQQHVSHEVARMRGALSRQRVSGQWLARDEEHSGPLGYLIELHAPLTGLVRGQHPGLAPAATTVSDSEGAFACTSGTSGMVTLTIAGDGRPIDWAYNTLGSFAHGHTYAKTSIFLSDASLAPHLELESGFYYAAPWEQQAPAAVGDAEGAAAGAAAATGNGSGSGPERQRTLLIYLSMDPRLSLELHPHWIDRYMTSTPSRAPRSWAELERSCAELPGWRRFTSSNWHVRVFSSQSILFNMPDTPSNRAAVMEVVQEAAELWLAWLQKDEAEGRHQVTDPKMLAELAAHSAAWRRFPRREAGTAAFKELFGEQKIEDYWDSLAGDARIRLP